MELVTGMVRFGGDAPAHERRVLVAIVHNQPVVLTSVAQGLMGIGWGNRIARAKAEHQIAAIDQAWFAKLPRVDAMRDLALEQAHRDGFSHVLFLDADMIHPDDLFLQILRHVDVHGIVSGFYTLKSGSYAPVALTKGTPTESGRFRIYEHDHAFDEGLDDRGLKAEEIVGMGCTLIPLALLDAIGPRPWFEYRTDDDGWPTISEDVPFCEKARAAGWGVYLDPSIECGHCFPGVADKRYARRYQQSVAATEARLAKSLTIRDADVPVEVDA